MLRRSAKGISPGGRLETVTIARSLLPCRALEVTTLMYFSLPSTRTLLKPGRSIGVGSMLRKAIVEGEGAGSSPPSSCLGSSLGFGVDEGGGAEEDEGAMSLGMLSTE